MESLQVRKMTNKPNPFGLGMLHELFKHILYVLRLVLQVFV
jgi:hypothetical protein